MSGNELSLMSPSWISSHQMKRGSPCLHMMRQVCDIPLHPPHSPPYAPPDHIVACTARRLALVRLQLRHYFRRGTSGNAVVGERCLFTANEELQA